MRKRIDNLNLLAAGQNIVVTWTILQLLTNPMILHGKSDPDLKACLYLVNVGKLPRNVKSTWFSISSSHAFSSRTPRSYPEKQTTTTTTIRWKIARRIWVTKLEFKENLLTALRMIASCSTFSMQTCKTNVSISGCYAFVDESRHPSLVELGHLQDHKNSRRFESFISSTLKLVVEHSEEILNVKMAGMFISVMGEISVVSRLTD